MTNIPEDCIVIKSIKMQIDVGNEPYLSQQKAISYVSTGLSITVSDELAEDYCYGKEW